MMDRALILPHIMVKLAADRGDAIAVQEVESDRAVTWSQLHESVLRWAASYQRQRVGAGDTVVTMLPNRVESLTAWLGAAWLTAIEVPINTAYRGHMLSHVINDSRARLLVVATEYLEQLAQVAGELPNLERVVIVDAPDPLPELPADVMSLETFLDASAPATGLAGPEHYDVACMIYTSGTTGPSKGVLMPWRELYEFASSPPPGMLEEGRGLYNVLPVFHVSGKQALWMTALNRSRLVIRGVFSLSEFWTDIKRFDCTATGIIGMMGSLLIRQPPHADEQDTPLAGCAMGPLIPELDEFRQRFGVEVYSGYGMTEIGVPLGTDGFKVADWRSCGRPRPGYEVRVVDEHDEPVGPGVVGEFVVRTDEPWMLNAGYWGLPDKTAEAWRNGWFHTGDALMYDEDGNFYFVDRIKDAIRRRGENISSFEVEKYVGEHEAVLECAAIGVPSDVSEDDLKICVVLKPDRKLTPAELDEFLAPRMPRFMLPRYIEICDALPKTPTLRVQKVELRKDALNTNTWDRDRA